MVASGSYYDAGCEAALRSSGAENAGWRLRVWEQQQMGGGWCRAEAASGRQVELVGVTVWVCAREKWQVLVVCIQGCVVVAAAAGKHTWLTSGTEGTQRHVSVSKRETESTDE